jgi:hypothetical protein
VGLIATGYGALAKRVLGSARVQGEGNYFEFVGMLVALFGVGEK